MPKRHHWNHRKRSTPDTSHAGDHPQTTAPATTEEARAAHVAEIRKLEEQILERLSYLEAIEADENELDDKTKAQFACPLVTDDDVVCSEIARDEFTAFIEEHGESYLGKNVRLVDFLLVRSGLKQFQADYLGANIKDAVASVIEFRDQTFDKMNSLDGTWNMLLTILRKYAVDLNCEEEMEAFIQLPEGVVPRGLWNKVWRQFSTIPSPTAFNTTSHRMKNDVIRFMVIKDIEGQE